MPSIVWLPRVPTPETMRKLKHTLLKFPYVYHSVKTEDGSYIFLENEKELFARKSIESAGIEEGKEQTDKILLKNPSKRYKVQKP